MQVVFLLQLPPPEKFKFCKLRLAVHISTFMPFSNKDSFNLGTFLVFFFFGCCWVLGYFGWVVMGLMCCRR
ncbi:hypothetical protein PRUPE_3G173200 [Prunus persica]|uniref:Uncharacterized protein n=1 Tax=Prunus persica TaxID=3760 RepID=M5XFV5_PRUPE|nr:hypothetical protein PRUPE_3G173200 [Prunus persica]